MCRVGICITCIVGVTERLLSCRSKEILDGLSVQLQERQCHCHRSIYWYNISECKKYLQHQWNLVDDDNSYAYRPFPPSRTPGPALVGWFLRAYCPQNQGYPSYRSSQSLFVRRQRLFLHRISISINKKFFCVRVNVRLHVPLKPFKTSFMTGRPTYSYTVSWEACISKA